MACREARVKPTWLFSFCLVCFKDNFDPSGKGSLEEDEMDKGGT